MVSYELLAIDNNVMLPPYIFSMIVGTASVVESFVGIFWFVERNINQSIVNRPIYTQRCNSGSIILPYPLTTPLEIRNLYMNGRFMIDIKEYNIMFSMNSFGADVDDEINKGRGPYVFKISGQNFHWIGSKRRSSTLSYIVIDNNV